MQLPFSPDQFFALFASFNRLLWPILVVVWLATLWTAVTVVRGQARAQTVALVVAAHWFWSGIAYHAFFFTRINPAAWLFTTIFVAQGILFLLAATRQQLAFEWQPSLRQLAGVLLMGASLVYPLLVLLTGHNFPGAPAAGVPCPTTLFTAGVLLCATSTVPRVLLIAPIAWSIVGGSAAVVLGMTPDLLLFVAAACLSVLLLPGSVLRRLGNWGTADEEVATGMRGDGRVPHPDFSMTLTRVTAARPEHVWPWLLQMGYRRGGLYSYDWLDRLFGYLDGPSATRILPQFQHLAPGDAIPIGAGADFPVLIVDPNRTLVLGGCEAGMTWSWEIAVEPIDSSSSRITSRCQGRVPHTFTSFVFMALLGPAAFLMTRRMLIGLAQRAETLVREWHQAA
jgi:hypothetical protein